MAETQEARIEVDQTPYGYEVEKAAIQQWMQKYLQVMH